MSRPLLILLGLLVAGVYLRHCTRVPPDVQIVQPTLEGCGPAILAERRPIVLTERLADHGELLNTVFKWTYLWSSGPSEVAPGEDGRASAWTRFTILYDPDKDVDVDIAPPTTSGSPTTSEDDKVRVRLRRSQTLVLPPSWRYSVSQPGCRAIRLTGL